MSNPQQNVVSAVIAAADRGEPFGVKDLLRYDGAEVRRAFDAGAIYKGKLRIGGQDLVAILPTPPDEDDSGWSDDELQYLELAYTSGVSFSEMARALQRSGGAILQQAWRMKMVRPHAWDRWATHVPAWRARRFRALIEEARVRGANSDDDGADIEHRALRRAFAAGRADVAGRERHQRPWSQGELDRLAQLREGGATLAGLAQDLRRSSSAITSKLSQLGLVREWRWSEDEDRILVAGLDSGMTAKDIAAYLPGRSVLACKQRGMKLVPGRGFDLWDEDEDHALRLAVERGENLKTFAAGIGRTPGGVRWRCRHLGLVHPDRVVPYTASDDRRIIEGWKRKERPQEIADDLARPIAGIYNRAFKLGITGKGPGHYHRAVRQFEVDYVRVRVAQDWTANEIAAKLRRSHHMVYQIAKKNGIAWARRGGRRRAAA